MTLTTLSPEILNQLLQFAPESGRLNFDQQRVHLFNQNALALLHKQLRHHLGLDMTRSVLAKFGFECARNDFAVLKERFTWLDENSLLQAGPLMHAWAGIVLVEPLQMEMDQASGHFYFKGLWHNSYEAENHLKLYGLADHPVCFSLAGYGSGWCSSFLGQEVLEIETQCLARGDPHCAWEIRPKDAWGEEADPWRRALYADHQSIFRELEDRTKELDEVNLNLESRVQDAIQKNQQLLRILSHDLAAPVSTLKSMLTRQSPQPSQEDRCLMLQIISSVETLLRQVRSQQAASSGKIQIKRTVIRLAEILNEVQAVFRERLRAKQLTLHLDIQPADLQVLADPISLTHNILANLLSNAIKFSPRNGAIYISAVAVGRSVHIKVKDEGIGMPPELLARVFDEKTMTSRQGTEGEDGTGFGMPLVKHFVELNGGSIDVESVSIMSNAEQCGTTATVRLMAGSFEFPKFKQ